MLRPAPVLIISGSPSSLAAAEACRRHFPDCIVVDISTADGRERLAEILEARRAAGGRVSIDLVAR